MSVGKLFAIACLCTLIAVPAAAGIWVSAPGKPSASTSGTASATSPVHFVATANSPACSKGVSHIGIYTTPNSLAYTVNASSLDTNLALNAGTYNVAVQEWDNCGWSSKAMLTLTVGGSTSGNPPPPSGKSFPNLQNQKGWSGYALLPPSWGICASCTSAGPQLRWSWAPGASSPSMDGISTKSVYG